MKADQLKLWQKQVSNKKENCIGEVSYLHGVTIANSFLKNALLSTQGRDKKRQPVLFIFLMQNYKKYCGFRLNTEAYAVDPSKGDVVL